MLETIQNFESVVIPAARAYPLYAMAPGSTGVVVGLFIWLGGLGFKRVLMAIAGAAGGFALGYFAIGRGVIPAAVLAGVLALIMAIFDRVSIALLAAILVAGIGFVVLAGPRISIENGQEGSEARDETANSDESMERFKAYLYEVRGQVTSAWSDVPVYQWLIVVVLTIITLVVGFLLRRLTVATCFSVLGTLLIAAGLVVLLLFKGATPLSRVGNRPLTYVGIVAGMVAFGAVEQLLFCRGGILKPSKKPKTDDFDDETGRKRRRNY
jgi:hypothetical protein